ncbi:MAG: hypothetical protein U9N52_01855 [Campylobacterota bacterium]|nr:hypothetical protein [Campylobacterota bacterium]
MKWLYGILTLLVLIVALVYTLAFTSIGNGILAPIVEKKINESLHVKSKLETFELDSSAFNIILALTPKNKITVVGNYGLFSQSFNISYRLRLNNLEALKPLTKERLYGKFHTEGTVIGDLAKIDIKGSSDIASSQTRYDVTLTDFNPSSIKAIINGAKTEELLALVGKAPYAISTLHVNADMSSVDPQNLQGDLNIALKDGHIDAALMQRDFNLTLPKTRFTLTQKAELRGQDINYNTLFESNLAKILSSGVVSPQPLKTDLSYEINFEELALLQPITNAPLRGPFSTKGSVKGDEALMKVLGSSDIAQSKTAYDIELKALKPSKVLATIKDAKLEKLLYMGGQNAYATAMLNADVKLENLDPKNLQGIAKLSLKEGQINPKLMKRDFNVTLPQTAFVFESSTQLKGKDVAYDIFLNSNLAEIRSQGELQPETMAMDLNYQLNIEMLELLKPITNAPLRGAFNLKGTAKGDKKSLHVKGSSDVANSDTRFKAELIEFKPKTLNATIKNLKLAKLLYMLEQPHYLQEGILNTTVAIKDASSEQLDGTVSTRITKGLIDAKATAKAFEFKPMPRITFDAQTDSVLKGTTVTTKLDVNSNIMTIDVASATFDLKDSSIKSDYVMKLLDLSKLYFVTEQEMIGDIAFNGEFKKDKDLDFTAHSKTLDGTIDAHLHNDDFTAELKNLQTLKALHMVLYPEIFKSSLNGTLKYNLALKKGSLDSKLSNGQFTQNEMGDLLKQYAQYDLYAERFETTLKSDITSKRIISNVMMKGGTVSISDKKMLLAVKSKQIKSDLNVVINNNPVTIKLRGNVKKPDVKIDANELIQREAGKAIEKELGNLLKGLF